MSIFKNIEKSLIKKHSFVCYRKPNDTIISALFQNNDNIHTNNNLDSSGFVFAPFDDRNDTIIIPKESSTFLQETFSKSNINITKTTNSKDYDSREFHVNLVDKGIDAILNKNFKKVVLSRKEIVNLKDGFNSIKLFETLLNTYSNALVYIWFHPKIGLWLGATPETLVKINNDYFETMSLAGTLPYIENTIPKWTSKEIEEQQFVTDYIVEKLAPLCKTLNTDKTETIKAGTLLHLKTKIEGKLAVSNSELIKTLHPTPAVCGLPKDSSKQFIIKNENYNRSFYTGFLGELNMNNVTELFVNLRCMEIKNSEALIYVGGGITKNSISDREWEETTEKAMVMKRII
ncbi:isochorismate synthase [Tenacibaculum sp. MAR_2009_124]|uniref:chorismate-binding protein n=1 Tax=Tenacibaculum sp. MAR_2009_124 TaxID=1250059 RepID=UPI0008991453|nr:chorismate-binding protein [Tenacibaculum sp. MAR_2009_124]SEB83683.1 isochorismate synthase [Tenacibaculum sp. MAR_2009_124]